jgi:hypothetical protein
MGIDVAKIMDGYPVDDLIRAIANRKMDAAARILKGHCERFLNSDTGCDLVNSLLEDWEQDARDAAAEAKFDGRHDEF